MLQCQMLCSLRPQDCASVNHNCVRVRTFAFASIALAPLLPEMRSCVPVCMKVKRFCGRVNRNCIRAVTNSSLLFDTQFSFPYHLSEQKRLLFCIGVRTSAMNLPDMAATRTT